MFFQIFFSNFTENWAENKSKKLTWSTICFFCQILAILNSFGGFQFSGLVIKKLLSKSNWIQSSLFPCVPYIPWGQKSRFWLNSVKKFRIRGGVGGVGVTISRLKNCTIFWQFQILGYPSNALNQSKNLSKKAFL